MKKIHYILSLVLASLFTSCYDDLGNYTYKEINDVVIDMPRTYYVKIPLVDSTIVSIPVSYTQVKTQGNDNLRYQWSISKTGGARESDWTPCGNEPTVKFAVYPNDPQKIYLRVAVTDTDLDIVTYGEVTVRLQHAFDPCWFLLQEIDGNAVLGVADGKEGVVAVTQDAYKAYANATITGKPKFLSVNVRHSTGDATMLGTPDVPMLQIYTDHDILILDGGNLSKKLYTYERMLLDKLKKGDTNYNPIFAAGDQAGECIIDNGQFWFAFDDGCAIFYPVATSDNSQYYATMASVSYTRGAKIVFDNLNKRFLSYTNDNMPLVWHTHKRIAWDNNYVLYDVNHRLANGPKLQPIGESGTTNNVFSPNAIGADKDVIYMGPTTNSDYPEILSVARVGTGNMFYVYEISPKAIMGENRRKPYCSGYWEFKPEEDFSGKKVSVATSVAFDRIFFYAAGSKIYRVDLNRSVPTAFEIYSSTEGEITGLKFRSDRNDVGYATEDMSEDDPYIMNMYPTWLGAIVTDQSGNSSLVEMKLNRAGDIIIDKESKEKVVYKYTGFRNVVDFAYSFRY